MELLLIVDYALSFPESRKQDDDDDYKKNYFCFHVD
jgi:hypothetical protein